jgi:PPOX class probable F420-dependent enzyme
MAGGRQVRVHLVTASLPQAARDLVDRPEYAVVATLEPSGQPHLSVIWVGRDGDDVLFSTLRGRRKTDNLTRNPRCTVLVYPREDPYHYLEIRGTATITDDPEAALIDEMALKYTGKERFGGVRDRRVVVRVTPDHVVQRDN